MILAIWRPGGGAGALTRGGGSGLAGRFGGSPRGTVD